MNANVYTREMKIIGAVLLQLAVILFMILFKISILQGGTDIALRIAPVDPRDPLRGDYVTFQYDISRVPNYYDRDDISNGQTVYVPLRQAGKYWVIYGQISETLPRNSNDDVIYLKGVVKRGGRSGGVPSSISDLSAIEPRGGDLHVVYGIEEYFIPEGRGWGVSFWNREAFARVAVDDRGNAVIKQLYVDDRPWP